MLCNWFRTVLDTGAKVSRHQCKTLKCRYPHLPFSMKNLLITPHFAVEYDKYSPFLFSRFIRTVGLLSSRINTPKHGSTGWSCLGNPFPTWKPYVRSTVTCWNTCSKLLTRWWSSVQMQACYASAPATMPSPVWGKILGGSTFCKSLLVRTMFEVCHKRRCIPCI